MIAKRGIKLFGEKALKAVIQGYEQLDKLKVFEPLNISTLLSQ